MPTRMKLTRLGDRVGASVGRLVGLRVGDDKGESVGLRVGD